MKLWREWCLQPNTRRGAMLPLSRFKDILRAPDSGYASVYMFDGVAAAQIIKAKSSAGLSRYPVYSDTLMIDLDDGARQLRKAEDELLSRRLGYEVWASGGKGFHIAIPLVAMVSGLDVPYSQRKWVEALGIGADLSLYQHGRILSLPGRVHPKTGNKKSKVKVVPGARLEVPMLVAPMPTFAVGESEQGELEQGLWQLIGLIENEPEPGNRHTKIWSTAKSLADAGLEYDTALDLLTRINSQWENPKVALELTAAVQQAYRK